MLFSSPHPGVEPEVLALFADHPTVRVLSRGLCSSQAEHALFKVAKHVWRYPFSSKVGEPGKPLGQFEPADRAAKTIRLWIEKDAYGAAQNDEAYVCVFRDGTLVMGSKTPEGHCRILPVAFCALHFRPKDDPASSTFLDDLLDAAAKGASLLSVMRTPWPITRDAPPAGYPLPEDVHIPAWMNTGEHNWAPRRVFWGDCASIAANGFTAESGTGARFCCTVEGRLVKRDGTSGPMMAQVDEWRAPEPGAQPQWVLCPARTARLRAFFESAHHPLPLAWQGAMPAAVMNRNVSAVSAPSATRSSHAQLNDLRGLNFMLEGRLEGLFGEAIADLRVELARRETDKNARKTATATLLP